MMSGEPRVTPKLASVTSARWAVAVFTAVLALAGCSGKSSGDSGGHAGSGSGFGGAKSSGGRSSGGAPSSASGGTPSSDEAGTGGTDASSNGGTPGSTEEAGAGGIALGDGGTDPGAPPVTGGSAGDTASSGGTASGGSAQGGSEASGGTMGAGPMPGIVCVTGEHCELGNICTLCVRGTSQSVLCTPDPASDPDGYAAATAACTLGTLLQACDGPEDCATGEHCVVGKNNTITAQCSADFAAGALECRFAGLPMHPSCTLCWSDADCPEAEACRFVTGLPNEVGGCLPR